MEQGPLHPSPEEVRREKRKNPLPLSLSLPRYCRRAALFVHHSPPDCCLLSSHATGKTALHHLQRKYRSSRPHYRRRIKLKSAQDQSNYFFIPWNCLQIARIERRAPNRISGLFVTAERSPPSSMRRLFVPVLKALIYHPPSKDIETSMCVHAGEEKVLFGVKMDYGPI